MSRRAWWNEVPGSTVPGLLGPVAPHPSSGAGEAKGGSGRRSGKAPVRAGCLLAAVRPVYASLGRRVRIEHKHSYMVYLIHGLFNVKKFFFSLTSLSASNVFTFYFYLKHGTLLMKCWMCAFSCGLSASGLCWCKAEGTQWMVVQAPHLLLSSSAQSFQ